MRRAVESVPVSPYLTLLLRQTHQLTCSLAILIVDDFPIDDVVFVTRYV